MSSGIPPPSAVTFEKVRAALRLVSRCGQSHAVSICAWPIALTTCALAFAGRSRATATTARAARAVAAMSLVSRQSSARSRVRRISWRRGSSVDSACMSSDSTCKVRLELPHVVVADREVSPAQLEQRGVVGGQPVTSRPSERIPVRGRRGSRRPPRGTSPARARRRRRHDGHVSDSLGECPSAGLRMASYTSASAWNPGQSPAKPRSNNASTRHPAHSAGTTPSALIHSVDHGVPQASPTAIGS